MLTAGKYHTLKIVKKVEFGLYLDADGTEVLLPKRFVPRDANEGDELEVFLYHDGEDRIIATTQKPKAIVGEIALMKVVHINVHGAFLEWGIMKDLFVPLSQQFNKMYEGREYLVYVYLDEQTGRVAATEKIQKYLSNEVLTVEEKEAVDLILFHPTDIGWKVIINNKHTGVLHTSDIYQEIKVGDRLKGYIKTLRPENKIDVMLGEIGYKKVGTASEKIMEQLRINGGFLPFNDKSSPEIISETFGISKKTFKMTVGNLYKERKIDITQAGIMLIDGD